MVSEPAPAGEERPAGRSEPSEGAFNYRMWNDYQWSMRIAPPPLPPCVVTGV